MVASRRALGALVWVATLGGWSMPVRAQEGRAVKDATIWVADDTVKIDPVTGQPIGKPEQQARREDRIWDAGTRTVRLFGGRNEFVSFQILIERGKDPLHKVMVHATDLLGSSERISADRHVRLFKQLYVSLGGKWYPDALVPLEIASAGLLELPEPESAVGPEQRLLALWADIYVPQGLKPDVYKGQIRIVHRGTHSLARLNVELEVGKVQLPDSLGLDVDLMNYGFLTVERGWPELWIDSPRHRAIEREFFRMAHEHRMTFAIVPYNHDGSIPRGQKPELAGTGEQIRVSDWSAWDERYGAVLSGEAFADLPRSGEPVSHFILPFNVMWPSDMRNWQKPAYRTEHIRIGQIFIEHLKSKGWTKPRYQVYYNHKEHYGFFPWNLDEPTREQDLDALRYLGQIFEESFSGSGPIRIQFRVDIGHFHCENVKECQHPSGLSRVVTGRLNPYVDLWNVGAPHYAANLPEIRKLKADRKTVYFYSGTPRVTEPLVRSVFWGWLAYRYEADGICFWNATDWTDWDSDETPRDPYTNAGGRYEGFSMVFYPGRKFGYDGPIPSIRLKALRRGLQDFEYLSQIETQGITSRSELVKVVDSLVEADGANYSRLRRWLFETLN